MKPKARKRAEERANEILAELFLREVRQAVGLSQADLAARMGIRQPSLSKLESEEQDMRLGTLQRIVEALGGQLDVIVRFPKGSVRLAQFSERAAQQGDTTRVGEIQLV